VSAIGERGFLESGFLESASVNILFHSGCFGNVVVGFGHNDESLLEIQGSNGMIVVKNAISQNMEPEIIYATQNIQDALNRLDHNFDLVFKPWEDLGPERYVN
jgi:hypothetical protein